MADNLTLDIPINKSPVPAALDMLYDFVKALVNVGENDLIGILGTIVEYDIKEHSPLYNDYVVRGFADRTVAVSPIAAQGPGDQADRYSARYLEMLKLLVASFDRALTADAQAQVDKAEAAIKAISDDRDAWLEKIDTAWTAKMTNLGIDPTKIDTDANVRQRYYDERTYFLTQHGYAQKLEGDDGYNTRIREQESDIRDIRLKAFPDDDARQIYDLYDYAMQAQVIRPKDPDLEVAHHWDAFTI